MMNLKPGPMARCKMGVGAAHLIGVALLLTGAAFTLAVVGAAQVSLAGPPPEASPHSDIAPTTASVTTTLHLDGTVGEEGWFVSPVTVALSVEGDDLATFYRLDGEDWLTYTSPFLVVPDGVHVLDYYSTDVTNTSEPAVTTQFGIDTTAPSSSADTLAAYQETTSFVVNWSGSDSRGSGVRGFDVQYKDSLLGTWRAWLTGTTSTSATFGPVQRGHAYYFQTRASDFAGNREPYPGGRGDAFTFVDSVANGGFESGTFAAWTVSGEMSKTLVFAPPAGGTGQWSALLGSPDYGDSPDAEWHTPVGDASIRQAIVVPSLADLPSPSLSLWYRIMTFDVVYGCLETNGLLDSFDLTIQDETGHVLAMPVRDGNFDCLGWNEYYDEHNNEPPLTDIAARRVIDLTPYAGQTIVIEMQNANRQDEWYNTWTYVDDVHVINQPTPYLFRAFLPIVGRDIGYGRAPAGHAAEAPARGGPRR